MVLRSLSFSKPSGFLSSILILIVFVISCRSSNNPQSPNPTPPDNPSPNLFDLEAFADAYLIRTFPKGALSLGKDKTLQLEKTAKVPLKSHLCAIQWNLGLSDFSDKSKLNMTKLDAGSLRWSYAVKVDANLSSQVSYDATFSFPGVADVKRTGVFLLSGVGGLADASSSDDNKEDPKVALERLTLDFLKEYKAKDHFVGFGKRFSLPKAYDSKHPEIGEIKIAWEKPIMVKKGTESAYEYYESESFKEEEASFVWLGSEEKHKGYLTFRVSFEGETGGVYIPQDKESNAEFIHLKFRTSINLEKSIKFYLDEEFSGLYKSGLVVTLGKNPIAFPKPSRDKFLKVMVVLADPNEKRVKISATKSGNFKLAWAKDFKSKDDEVIKIIFTFTYGETSKNIPYDLVLRSREKAKKMTQEEKDYELLVAQALKVSSTPFGKNMWGRNKKEFFTTIIRNSLLVGLTDDDSKFEKLQKFEGNLKMPQLEEAFNQHAPKIDFKSNSDVFKEVFVEERESYGDEGSDSDFGSDSD